MWALGLSYTEVELAAQILSAPAFYLAKLNTPVGIHQGIIFFAGADQGYEFGDGGPPPVGSPNFPYGHAVAPD